MSNFLHYTCDCGAVSNVDLETATAHLRQVHGVAEINGGVKEISRDEGPYFDTAVYEWDFGGGVVVRQTVVWDKAGVA